MAEWGAPTHTFFTSRIGLLLGSSHTAFQGSVSGAAYTARYTGWFQAPQTGEQGWKVAFYYNGASEHAVLRIDGIQVLRAKGGGTAAATGSFFTLAQRWYKVELVHALTSNAMNNNNGLVAYFNYPQSGPKRLWNWTEAILDDSTELGSGRVWPTPDIVNGVIIRAHF